MLTSLDAALKVGRAIDVINRWFAVVAEWCLLLAVLISAGNAFSRYLFNYTSNAFLESQWYMFGALVLFGAPYTLRLNEHVRVDVLYSAVSERMRLLIDTFGILLFLLPATIFLTWLTWNQFVVAFYQGETSSQFGGLVRWPIKLVLPIGFALLALQGISELIKRIAALAGRVEVDANYERPVQ